MPDESFVRPYLLTGGRTRPPEGAVVPVEAMVLSVGRDGTDLAPELRSIVDRCETPKALAEVAALESIPLGVARVLVGDLIADGRLGLCEVADNSDESIIRRLHHALSGNV
ncbi:MAG: DUF742 domain-containing protein [Acidimicrobiales bacterium]